MNRRSFLRVTPVVALSAAGCLGGDSGSGFSAGGSNGGDEDDEEGDNAGNGVIGDDVETLRERFESQGLDVRDAETDAETIVFQIQTSGDVDEDIRRAASAYATEIGNLDRDLRVRVEDRGLHQETFEIEAEWAQQFVDGRIGDNEYLDRINETRL